MKVLALYGSSRAGNSDYLTDTALEGIECTRIYLRDKKILPIDDGRHTEKGFLPVDDDYDYVITEMLKHDVVLFATPIYWYGMSGIMKNFVDRWSQSLRDSRYNFKEDIQGKQGYVLLTGGDQPRLKGLPLIQQFQYIFDFVGMSFNGYIIGEGNKPNDVKNDKTALFEAQQLNLHLKTLVN
ncbi:flavodoxin family protein [Heyndrickxia acidicola]|uniref:Flavodoxin family protein n=1 Tax=Heyndrickxia acidicola TaxID=209389 RepID=A0ABU6MEQ6_9BACI|nr:flavodoxin family protein [Heyndrickxia acidicola]MED1201752.1 flavodoxin family protein [Heyndrickxia acidicola]